MQETNRGKYSRPDHAMRAQQWGATSPTAPNRKAPAAIPAWEAIVYKYTGFRRPLRYLTINTAVVRPAVDGPHPIQLRPICLWHPTGSTRSSFSAPFHPPLSRQGGGIAAAGQRSASLEVADDVIATPAPSRRRIAVSVKLQHRRRVIARPASLERIDACEAELAQVQAVHESIDGAHGDCPRRHNPQATQGTRWSGCDPTLQQIPPSIPPPNHTAKLPSPRVFTQPGPGAELSGRARILHSRRTS